MGRGIGVLGDEGRVCLAGWRGLVLGGLRKGRE
jgi:hypothetical protein